jgi:ABC-type polysaccharide/polyol phosphate transport system ATPase subunit
MLHKIKKYHKDMIQVHGVSKNFKLYHSPADRLKEILTRKLYHRNFVALDNISFKVHSGQTLGIIGQNGAGKSTLLKIISGILIPDSGTINSTGKVTGLLELGTGFNHEMTGIENIYMNGILIGMSRDEIDLKKQQIIDFSELGEFINEPLKTYSSGMIMRLAFSIAIYANPSCFLVDEALSVGDAYFQQKCLEKIQNFRVHGGSIIFVSHDMTMIMTLCDHALLLEEGKILAQGPPKGIVDLYISTICKKSHKGLKEVIIQNSLTEEQDIRSDISTNEIEFTSLSIMDTIQKDITHVSSGQEVIVSFSFHSLRVIEEPVFGILFRNRYGVSIFGTNTYLLKQKIDPIYPGQNGMVSFQITINLQPDNYLISIAVDNKGFGINSFKEYLLRLNNIAVLEVIKTEDESCYEGITNLHPVVCVSITK